jgi:hypothetical protein
MKTYTGQRREGKGRGEIQGAGILGGGGLQIEGHSFEGGGIRGTLERYWD